MRKCFIALLMVLLFSSVSYSQVLTLNSPEALAVPTATHIELTKVNIDVTRQSVDVTYRFLASGGGTIQAPGGNVDRNWHCENRAPQLVANCTALNEPYRCCTGVGTGTGCDVGSTCFTDTFGFVIRAQDVGVGIGKGLRALIWSKMRPDVLVGSNNATLP